MGGKRKRMTMGAAGGGKKAKRSKKGGSKASKTGSKEQGISGEERKVRQIRVTRPGQMKYYIEHGLRSMEMRERREQTLHYGKKREEGGKEKWNFRAYRDTDSRAEHDGRGRKTRIQMELKIKEEDEKEKEEGSNESEEEKEG
ncbi:MAG: hypothetical protein DHS80DRAFT_23172 [Piptocephalis tieghemiana]|nr:MAG: hypothetical protein DHS80DRAFT_23172 [Piptocephalis tieghemiana]